MNDFKHFIDLASEKLGGKTLSTSDDFFAPMENLLKSSEPIFIPDKYTEFGKWMDGWESRRKRNLGPGNDHDWCILRLGLPGVIRGFNVNTAHFLGNFPEHCSIEATSDREVNESTKWREILPKSKLQGGSENLFPISNSETWTHLRLNIFPDGGVARLRVHGDVTPDWDRLGKIKGPIDLAAIENGGVVVTCNDNFFGHKDNLIMPGRAKTMGEGWETRRRRGPGYDWIVVKLATSGKIQKVEIDTNHFKGNYPESFSLEGCAYQRRSLTAEEAKNPKLEWKEIISRTKLQAHHQHYFEKEIMHQDIKFDYVRLNIYPDGGISRMRVHGIID